MSTDRACSVCLPIVIGSYSFQINKDINKDINNINNNNNNNNINNNIDDDSTHAWICLVRSPNGQHLSSVISKVVFRLHPTLPNPVRHINTPPFQTNANGWGEFQIAVELHFWDKNLEKVELLHELLLNSVYGTAKYIQVDENNINMGKCLVSETYEELRFTDPSDLISDSLTRAYSNKSTPALQHPELYKYFNIFTDKEELNILNISSMKVKKEIDLLNKILNIINNNNNNNTSNNNNIDTHTHTHTHTETHTH
eukprot:GHVR01192093.1.p1 GENE.GHVR01192093.1~~GHVR01192093.1.p1  ORF type:complete len:255 (+),score=128.22 GHVR01192093.1:224-988(+)